MPSFNMGLSNDCGIVIVRIEALDCGKVQMATNISLEERLAAVEAVVAELQKQAAASQLMNWLKQVTGAFKDEPAFEEVLAYGRAIRLGHKSVLED